MGDEKRVSISDPGDGVKLPAPPGHGPAGFTDFHVSLFALVGGAGAPYLPLTLKQRV